VTNNFAVNPNYRLGYVQVWNLDIQRELPGGVVMNAGYNGAKERGWIRSAPWWSPAGSHLPTNLRREIQSYMRRRYACASAWPKDWG